MFDIITPCTRPKNLGIMYESILNALPNKDFVWHVVFDTHVLKQGEHDAVPSFPQVYTYEYGPEDGVAGKAQINYILDHLSNTTDTWVYVLDDDNILHPVFGRAVNSFIESKQPQRALCLMQQVTPDHFRTVEPARVKATFIDQAQYVLHRSLIGDRRYRQDYCGDGQFIEQIYQDFPDEFAFLNYPASYYNYLRWAHGEH